MSISKTNKPSHPSFPWINHGRLGSDFRRDVPVRDPVTGLAISAARERQADRVQQYADERGWKEHLLEVAPPRT
ncbi:uncharacterized protein J3R85_020557 [Psidium guajava]|nr:uncharacterized protein J3R85_020557 [Psidium guajava]